MVLKVILQELFGGAANADEKQGVRELLKPVFRSLHRKPLVPEIER